MQNSITKNLDTRSIFQPDNEPLSTFKALQLNEIAKPITKVEALQLAIAMTPNNVWEAECYKQDEERIKYLFDLASMIMMADRKKFGA